MFLCNKSSRLTATQFPGTGNTLEGFDQSLTLGPGDSAPLAPAVQVPLAAPERRVVAVGQVSLAATERQAATESTPLVFGHIVRDHSRYLFGLLSRLGVAHADLDDVAQEAFLAIHAQLSSFESRSTVKTWLCGICRNKASDYSRRAGRRRRLLAASAPEPEARGTNPQEELLQKEREALLHRELAKLPQEQREVFVLYEIDELSMKEVAAAVGCPLDTAYTRHRVARQRIQAAFLRADKSWGGA